ncbi:MAG: cytochrome P450 [Pirellulaceae bacterium]|nr:cytochrome P450 [Pirellulaceae bacterium]
MNRYPVISSPAVAATAATALPRAATTPPGPRGHWLYGQLREYRRDRLGFLESLKAEYGPLASYRLGHHPFVVVSEPAVIEEVLVTRNRQFGKFYITAMLREVFGDGLLTSEGDAWRQRRRMIQPTFATAQLAAAAPAMVRQTVDHVAAWQPGDERDLLAEMQRLTMAIAAETLLGLHLPADIAAIHEPHDLIRAEFDRRVESVWTAPRWLPTPRNLRMASAQRQIRGLVDRLIAERRRSNHSGPDVLSSLLVAGGEPGQRLTDEQIRNESLTFLFAGHETTASALAWAFYLLATHPAVEAQLHRELDEVLAGRMPTAGDYPRLKFTENIFRETLRLYPSAYGIGRQAQSECELGGFRIPRGTNVVLSQWLTHRDGRFFERPNEFDPSRWAPEFQKQLPHCAYFPFGVGPRVCVGNHFAMLEGTLVIATIASRYRLQIVPGQTIVPHPSVTLRPSPTVRLVCEPRWR